MLKDRKQTEEKILDAVDELTREKGVSSLGINSIARKAGISKVLIYRYFTNFDGLMESWALRHSYWAEENLAFRVSDNNWREAATSILSGHAEKLRSDKLRREVLRWLLNEKTVSGDKAMEKMEQNGLALMEIFNSMQEREKASETDSHTLIALLIAGINYLSLYSDQCSVFNGVEIDSDSGWKRIEACIRHVMEKEF